MKKTKRIIMTGTFFIAVAPHDDYDPEIEGYDPVAGKPYIIGDNKKFYRCNIFDSTEVDNIRVSFETPIKKIGKWAWAHNIKKI